MKATLSDLRLARRIRDYFSGETYWVTKAGEHIPVKDMTDTHLDNTIAMLERAENLAELEELACEFEAYREELDND